ncbi:enterochelin esterase [Rahnella sp. PCH160]|uniref:enterochelin esterase n=1 Tax=Rahnella sp. PCH160 TaxID=3447928 RepID=UPI0039FD7858
MMKSQHPEKCTAQAMLLSPQAGSAAWWHEIASRGTPWTEPLRDGFCGVTFFWRDPQGDEMTSETQRVWININGITDHHQSSPPQSLQRLAGTDVWYWQTELRADWRGSYSLIPRTEAGAEFPKNNDDYQSMLAAREWWKNLFRLATHDPLNPHRPWPGAKSHALSGLHMPGALPQPAWAEFDLHGPKAPQAPALLQTFRWKSARLGNMRNVWVFTTGEGLEPASRPLAILLDGQFWAKQMPVWQPLMQLTREGALPEAVYVLIDVIDIQSRSRELTCNPEFWLAVQDELLPQVKNLAAHSDNAQKTVVAGQSFGGLSSLYAGLHWPERFGCVLSQSGSFWWPRRNRQQASDDQQEAESILSQVEKGLGESSHLKIFMEAGRNEKLIYEVNNQMEALLKPTPNQVRYRVLEGGHDALWWRGGLLDGLCSLWDETPWAAGDPPSNG